MGHFCRPPPREVPPAGVPCTPYFFVPALTNEPPECLSYLRCVLHDFMRRAKERKSLSYFGLILIGSRKKCLGKKEL